MDFKAAKCPSCAGDLQLPDNLDSAKCMYCGNTIVVREAIQLAAGSVSMDNLLMLADAAFKTDNYKEAYDYYTKVLEYEPNNDKAWYGKGISAAWQSTIRDLRIDEGINCINIAFSKASADTLAFYKTNSALYLASLAGTLLKNVKKYLEIIGTSDGWSSTTTYLYGIIIKLYEFSFDCDPNSSIRVVYLQNIMFLYIDKYYLYQESIDEIKRIVVKLQAVDPSFSFASYATEIHANSSYTLSNNDFISFVNSIDYKNKLSPPPPPPAPANSGGCFIATAAWGTPLADQVVSLSLFRDNQLMQNEYGRRFVDLYYRVSPPIADLIRGNALLRSMVRAVLKPIVFAVKFMK